MTDQDKDKEPMKMLTVRAPMSLHEQIDQLMNQMNSGQSLHRVQRADLLRHILERGLEAVKEEVNDDQGD